MDEFKESAGDDIFSSSKGKGGRDSAHVELGHVCEPGSNPMRRVCTEVKGSFRRACKGLVPWLKVSAVRLLVIIVRNLFPSCVKSTWIGECGKGSI